MQSCVLSPPSDWTPELEATIAKQWKAPFVPLSAEVASALSVAMGETSPEVLQPLIALIVSWLVEQDIGVVIFGGPEPVVAQFKLQAKEAGIPHLGLAPVFNMVDTAIDDNGVETILATRTSALPLRFW